MRRIILAQLRGRPGRTLALLLGIMVATTSFTVLSSTAATSRLKVTGTVHDNFRSAYDVLVRPANSTIGLERDRGVVRPNFLSGLYGGITLDQYRLIGQTPGVEVAAPIAMIGYAVLKADMPLDLTDDLSAVGADQVLRVRRTWVEDRGTTEAVDGSSYLFSTERPLTRDVAGRPRAACTFPDVFSEAAGPFDPLIRSDLVCVSPEISLQDSGFAGGRVGVTTFWPFPLLIAAVDPVQEARLAGVDSAVVSGRYLHADDVPELATVGRTQHQVVPVLAPSRPYLDQTLELRVERLPASAARRPVESPAVSGALDAVPGRAVRMVKVPVETAYAQLLKQMRGENETYEDTINTFWTPGPVRYRKTAGDRLHPVTSDNPTAVWKDPFGPYGYTRIPKATEDVAFRKLTAHRVALSQANDFPVLRTVGEFDPDKLAGFSTLSSVPLETYVAPEAAAADSKTRHILGGQPLLPGGNVASYLQSPPLMLTTLGSLKTFTTAENTGVMGHAPLSAVRVRVKGVNGPDAVSRERVRAVAQQISDSTGLDVDITVGSSPSPVNIELPPGKFGRPELSLTEAWVKKGVAVAILTALDRKSLALFALILLVCALFVTNAAGAAVRARRTELGVLACLGWSPSKLFGALLGEVALVGLVAGVAGSALAVLGSRLAGGNVAAGRALIAIPAAVALALLAGLVPALRASQADPAAAVRPAVNDIRGGRRLRSVSGLALRNVVRTPGRSALAAAALAIGTAALTVLLSLTLAFRGVLVGSLLGDAVTVQVRPGDLVGVVATVALGAAAVADVLYLGIRERASELSTLRVTGWDESILQRLLGLEAALIGLSGSAVGVLLGLAGARALAGHLPPTLLLLAPALIVCGTIVAVAAAAVPALLLRRLPTTELLAEE